MMTDRIPPSQEPRLPRDVLEAIVHHVPVMVAVVDPGGRLIWANRDWERTLGSSRADLADSEFPAVVNADDRDRAARMLEAGDAGWEEVRLSRRDGRQVEVTWTIRRLPDGTRVVLGRDLTEQRQLSLRLSQAERLEMIGRLAGGVAHDFNNFLTVIAGNAQLLLEPGDRTNIGRSEVEGIARAAESARAVVKQLLAFSRREPGQSRVLDLNLAIEGLRDFIARLIGSEVRVELDLSREPAATRLEGGQAEQLVVNLLLNARDAMPNGGKVWVRTATIEVAPDRPDRARGLRPGRYVTLTVRDTGHGMDAETRHRVFEPFFTTKSLAGGTGLGLASVHAIVTQAGGVIDLASAPGQGSAFTVYLPAAAVADEEAAAPPTPVPLSRPATVLLVEDHDIVRSVCRRALESDGHRVFEAATVPHALQIANEVSHLDLLVADVRLGGENGVDLARTLRAERPTIRVLLISGYPSPRLWEAAFLEKPFTPAALVSAVRQVLAGFS